MNTRSMTRVAVIALVAGLMAADCLAQDDDAPQGRGAGRGAAAGRGRGAARGADAAPAPWFGLMLPPPPGKDPAVMVGERQPRPFVMPANEPAAPEFTGTTIRADLQTIVNFAKESRTSKEIGSGQMWGRVSGLPSSMKTVEWAADQFRKAGISDVKVQPIAQPANSNFWFPLSWEVRILGDPAFGPGSTDVVLQSAIPLSPSNLPTGTMTAPLVFVGSGGRAVIDHIDVKGKIAVQLAVPQGHMVFERGPVGAGADELERRGAVGVFNLVRLPGNELSRDFSNCGNPCFNIGGRDGHFLEQVFNRAAAAGVADKLRVQIKLTTENKTGLKAANAVAVVPGSSNASEVIVVDAHVDSWFDGAGDNGDGLAVMIALAKHFAKPQNRIERTLVFIASAGHHSPGMNGPSSFMQANADLAKRAVIALNIEHVAQRNFSPARSTAPDGYRQAIADTGEAPMYAGVTNGSPYVNSVLQQGVTRYGVNFVSEKSTMASGESGGFSSIRPVVTFMQAPPLYHTTGEVFEVISTPGLERIARFLAYFIKDASKTPRTQINPA